MTGRTNAIQVGTVNQRPTVEVVPQRDEIVVTLIVGAKVEITGHVAQRLTREYTGGVN